MPNGWQLIGQDSLFSLEPNQCDLRLVGIAIPAKATPGRYRLTYLVRDRKNPEVKAQYEAEVVVTSVVKLEIIPENIPQRVLAGDEYCAEFEISFRGNTPSLVNLDIISSKEFPVHPNHQQLLMQPGESKQIITIQEL